MTIALRFALLLAICGPILAVPARPGWVEGRVDGETFRYRMVGDEFCNWAETEDGGTLLMDREGRWCWAEPTGDGGLRPGASLYRPGSTPPAPAMNLRPDPAWLAAHVAPLRTQRDASSPLRNGARIEGQWNVLLVLIHYPDQSPQYTPAQFDAMMNEPGYGGNGSFNDYYEDLSYGRYSTVSTVTQWVEASHPHDYYGYNQGWQVARELVIEAVLAVDEAVDFAQFDNSGDGRVDALMIVHSDAGAEEGDQTNIWSHRWSLGGQSLILDGVTIDDYTMQPETQGSGHQATIGVYVHEFGHNLGLPDLYDTDYSSSGVGSWCVMSGGSWGGGAGGNAAVPVSFSAWCRMALGWATVLETDTELADHPLPATWLSDEIVRLELDAPGQYFLAENRTLTGWDRHQPAGGLLVFHIDELAGGNQNEDRPLVDLEQADGQRDLNHGYGADAGDPFPGSRNNRHFSAETTPSSRPYGGDHSPIQIARIGDPGDTLMASFFQQFVHQDLVWQGWVVVEDEDGDLWPSAGEVVGLQLRLENRGAALDSLWLTWETTPGLEVLDGQRLLLDVPAGAFETAAEPFRLQLDEDLPAGHLPVSLASEDAAGWQQPLAGNLVVGRAEVLLLVEEPAAAGAPWVEQALARLGFSRETRSRPGHPLTDLDQYPRLLWLTGEQSAAPAMERLLAAETFLQGGGRMWLSGQHWVEGLDEELALNWGVAAGPVAAGMPSVRGEGHGGLLDDEERLLLAGAGGAWNQQMPATSLLAQGDSQPVLRWRGSDLPAALRSERGTEEGGGRLLLCGFSIEAVHLANGYLSLDEMLERGWRWLDDGEYSEVETVGQRPQRAELALAPNPFNPATTLSFRLRAAAPVELQIWNLAGQRVRQLHLGHLAAGEHRQPIDFGGLASGLYIIELRGEGHEPQRTRALLLR
jgi:immune inhibitor A